MNGDDGVPLGLLHSRDEGVPQDARIVDHDVEAAELTDGLLHQAFRPVSVGDVLGVGHRTAARGDNLVNNLVRRSGV